MKWHLDQLARELADYQQMLAQKLIVRSMLLEKSQNQQ